METYAKARQVKQFEHAQRFGLNELASVRLLQLYVLSTDRDLSTRASGKPDKSRHLEKALNATSGWAAGVELPPHLSNLPRMQVSKSLTGDLGSALVRLAKHVDPAMAVPIAVEAFVAFGWPKGTDWTEGQPQLARNEGMAHLCPGISPVDVDEVVERHKSAMKRLRKDSLSPAAQATLGTFMLAATAVSGGAATAVGTAVGTHILGYSGAAATSAGLAFLGGESIAAGGFGMAGGTLLVNVAAHATSATSRRMVGTMLAKESSGTFASELAKLDTVVRYNPAAVGDLITSLKELRRQLRSELSASAPSSGKRAKRTWTHIKHMATDPTEISSHAKKLRRELPDKSERNLSASLRACDYELRHLESPEWKRQAAKVPRLFGFPAASKLLDLIDD